MGTKEFETAKFANSESRYIVDIEPLRSMAFECCAELQQAMGNWPKFNSAHEGYAVLLEEVDELWDHVKTNQKRRNHEAMRKECVQIAAMAMRFALEVCTEEGVKK